MSSGGAPTPAGTSVFTKHNWDMGMEYLWLNGWGIYHLMGGAFMTLMEGHLYRAVVHSTIKQDYGEDHVIIAVPLRKPLIYFCTNMEIIYMW